MSITVNGEIFHFNENFQINNNIFHKITLISFNRWVLKSLEEMCPKRKMSSIQCIFGDGFIDESIKFGTYLTAEILEDSYHLFFAPSSVWIIDFSNNFMDIQVYLRSMLYAENEQEFDEAYNLAYKTLNGNTHHLQYLEEIQLIEASSLDIW